jgi:hypothetical protein
MSEDQYQRSLQLVGQLQAAEAVLGAARKCVLPEDKRTMDLLDIAQQSLNKTLISAWEFKP